MVQQKIGEYDILVCWELNRTCNFKCPYCFQPIEDRIKAVDFSRDKTEKAINFFNNLNKTCKIAISGGEPFLHPHLLEICKRLSERHYIYIATNLLSPRVYEFAEKLNPERVKFRATVHITEIKRLKQEDEIIKKIIFLKQKGFSIDCCIVMWPPILDDFDNIYSNFRKHGITLRQLTFCGEFNGRKYPESYTDKDYQKMNHFQDLFEKDIQPKTLFLRHNFKLEKPKITREQMYKGALSFKGIPCFAGIVYLFLGYNGDIRRCGNLSETMGNIYNGEIKLLKNPLPCTTDICYGRFEGLNYAIENPKIITNREESIRENTPDKDYGSLGMKLKLLKEKIIKKILYKPQQPL